jgi:hypothetical protein
MRQDGSRVQTLSGKTRKKIREIIANRESRPLEEEVKRVIKGLAALEEDASVRVLNLSKAVVDAVECDLVCMM